MECIMHYASCCQLQGNGAVLHEYMGMYWKMMDEFASFLKIMIFSSWKKTKQILMWEEKTLWYRDKSKNVSLGLLFQNTSQFYLIFTFYCRQVSISFFCMHLVNFRWPPFLVSIQGWATITSSAKATCLVCLLLSHLIVYLSC